MHCKEYETNVVALSNKGVGEIVTDEFRNEPLKLIDVAVFFCTIESGDEVLNLDAVVNDITQIANDWVLKNILITPFAHLSNDLASMDVSRKILIEMTTRLDHAKQFTVTREHFGSDKSLSIHVSGHKANVRFREFKTK